MLDVHTQPSSFSTSSVRPVDRSVNVAILLAWGVNLGLMIVAPPAVTIATGSLWAALAGPTLGTFTTIALLCVAAGADLTLHPVTDGPPLLVRGVPLVVQMLLAMSAAQQFRAATAARMQARHDSLTSLLNRRGIFERLDAEVSRCLRFQRPLSVIVIDLDHFKRLNDTAGHLAADESLVRFASVLRRQTRTYDVVARLGGDEFLVLLPETLSQDAGALLERVHQVMKTEFADLPQRMTFSAGISQLDVAQTDAGRRAVEAADLAMLAAKRAGKDSWQIAAPAEQSRA